MLVPIHGFKVNCCCCDNWVLTSSPGLRGASLQLVQDNDWNYCVLTKMAVVLSVTWSLAGFFVTLECYISTFSAASSKILCPQPQQPEPLWVQTFPHPAFHPQLPRPKGPATLNLVLPTCFVFPSAPHKHFSSRKLRTLTVETRLTKGKGKMEVFWSFSPSCSPMPRMQLEMLFIYISYAYLLTLLYWSSHLAPKQTIPSSLKINCQKAEFLSRFPST